MINTIWRATKKELCEDLWLYYVQLCQETVSTLWNRKKRHNVISTIDVVLLFKKE